MDKDQESSSSIEASEEVQSEHGSTTDDENEEINYWEGLKRGILPFPAPLRLQSLLFIIGHLNQYRNETLALLPPRTRRELLLNLPVIDVCRLEGSGVTEGIDIEEVWKTLYCNRLPMHQKELKQFLKTVDDDEEMDSWKDCYFTSLYDLRLLRHDSDYDCKCEYVAHLQQDLLYGMYSYNGTLEVQECFGPRTRSCFGVETCARHCSRLTPSRYGWQYPDGRSIALRRDDRSPPTTIYATIPTLVEKCKFEAKQFSAFHGFLTSHYEKCFTDDYFRYWKLFLGSVRYLLVTHGEEQLHPGLKRILDAIFCSSHCKLSKLYIQGPRLYGYRSRGYDEVNQLMALLVPYLSPTPGPDTLAVPYAYLREVHIECTVQSATDAFNTSLILNHQNALEVVAIDNCNCFTSETPDAHLPLALTTFLKKSSFRELNLYDTKVATSLVLKLLHEFFSSQSTNHQKLCFDCVKVMPDKTAKVISTPSPTAVGSRSLEIVQCELQPEIASVFPPSMSFRKLTIDTGYKQQNAATVLDLFSHVQSLQVENMSLSVRTSNQNSKAVVNLLNLVETRNWSLHFHFFPSSQETPENTTTLVDAVTDITPTLVQLVTKGIVAHVGFDFASDEGLPEPAFETLLEEVFNGIQHSQSKIELDLSYCWLSYSSLECLYRTWNRCTDVKLKKLDLTGNELPQDNSNLQRMTDKLIHDSD